MGIPFIHLLNIRDLALKNGIPLDPGIEYGDSKMIYKITSVSKPPVIVMTIFLISLLIIYKIKR